MSINKTANSKRYISCILVCISFIAIKLLSLSGLAAQDWIQQYHQNRGDLRIMFYNTENLFDPFNDSLTRDDEFLPEGTRHWTWHKMKDKISKLSKVIIAIGGWEPPECIGLCEIENRMILNQLVYESPFSFYQYQIVHQESPDFRGIDVALLYNPKKLTLLAKEFVPVKLPFENRTTRDILCATFIFRSEDTIHIFVNHWPSKYGGQYDSEPNRRAAASTLKKILDTVKINNPGSKIMIMGDFNDPPDAFSISQVLGAQTGRDTIHAEKIYNLSYNISGVRAGGTHKYQGQWSVLDQFIVSGSLLNNKNGLTIAGENAIIFDPPFLLEQDETYFGLRPNRTYTGFSYHGGYSDHLPVFIDLVSNYSVK